jgi:hypothetical protein
MSYFGRWSPVFAVALMFAPLVVQTAPAADTLRVATFTVDVTPPAGSSLCDGLVKPVEGVDDPLYAKGVVLLGAEKPIVLVALDWVGIGNTGYDRFRGALADAVGTTPDRVAVHSLHQHDAPGCDFEADELASQYGLGRVVCDPPFCREVIERLAAAAKASLGGAEVATHVGHGKAKIEQVASARRVIGPDGKVKYTRTSATKNVEARAEPEGTIDPYVQMLSFWNGEKPLAVLSYYATHPMSHYGKGRVSADFIGLGRAANEKSSGVFQAHFNGAGGNVTAGKYNDGDPANRAILAERVAKGMAAAWKATVKQTVSAADVRWRTEPVLLPLSERYVEEKPLLEQLADTSLAPGRRAQFARHAVFARRIKAGQTILIQMLSLRGWYVLHMPGELFVEYQLAAQNIRSEPVMMAAYGDYGPGYIGMKWSYPQGGYETGVVSRVAPEVEDVLMAAVKKLLSADPICGVQAVPSPATKPAPTK